MRDYDVVQCKHNFVVEHNDRYKKQQKEQVKKIGGDDAHETCWLKESA